MAQQGARVDSSTVNHVMWLRDRGFSVSAIARMANVARNTVKRIVADAMEARGETAQNPEDFLINETDDDS